MPTASPRQLLADIILRSASRPDLDIFTNKEAERTIWPVKIQRNSGGRWSAPQGVVGVALVQSLPIHRSGTGYQQTPRLPWPVHIHSDAWLPPGLEPAGSTYLSPHSTWPQYPEHGIRPCDFRNRLG
jgi:hypothetical protein